MMRRGNFFRRRFFFQTQGAVSVEFAILASVFLLIIAAVIDFGHAYYMRQVVTNASREGARYGITYRTSTSGTRIAPSALSPTIQDYLLTNYLSGTLPDDANPNVTLAGTGFNNGTKGLPVEVTVTAVKNWFIVSNFVPGLGDQITLSATTVMLCE